jgi:periplasmic divalent cation tolerance protein
MEYILIITTANSMENASKIAHALLNERLVACVNVVPKIQSIYSWKNKVVEDKEIMMVMKTKAILFEKVKEKILGLHQYTTPEIISLEIKEGSEDYLNWIDKETV